MKTKDHTAFSLVEVIIALGVFVFSITVLLGMLPVGLKSVRSVQNEGNAVHIASSIFGLWQVAPSNAALTVPGAFTNLGTVGSSGTGTYYFDEYGSRVSSSNTASVAMDYSAASTGTPATWRVSLEFRWPAKVANNATNVATGIQSRTFIQDFVK